MRGPIVLLILAGACRPTVAIDVEAEVRYFAQLSPDGRGSPIYSSERLVSLANSELAGTLVFAWAAADLDPQRPNPEVMASAPISIAVDPCVGALPPPRVAKKFSPDGVAFDFPLSSVPALSVGWWPAACGPDGGAPDASVAEVQATAVGGMAHGLAVAPSGAVAVALLDRSEVRVARWPELDFGLSLPVREQPYDLAWSADGARLAVSHLRGRALAVVTVADRAAQFVSVSDHPHRVIFGSDGFVYSIGEGPHLRRIDPQRATITATLAVAADGQGLAVDPSDGHLFLSAREGGVQEVDLVTLQVRRTLPFPGRLSELVIGADRRLWVANQDGPIACWDLAEDRSCRSIPLPGDGAYGLALSPEGRELWASFPNQGEVAAFDPLSGAVLRRVELGGAPRQLGLSPDGREVLVSNEDGNVYRVPR